MRRALLRYIGMNGAFLKPLSSRSPTGSRGTQDLPQGLALCISLFLWVSPILRDEPSMVQLRAWDVSQGSLPLGSLELQFLHARLCEDAESASLLFSGFCLAS